MLEMLDSLIFSEVEEDSFGGDKGGSGGAPVGADLAWHSWREVEGVVDERGDAIAPENLWYFVMPVCQGLVQRGSQSI